MQIPSAIPSESIDPHFDWKDVSRLVLLSRSIDKLEESELAPRGKVLYQFSARGHELAQVLLGLSLDGKHDAAGAYYRSRPLLLTLGVSPEDALAAPMALSGSYSDGRDVGVVCNLPRRQGVCVLPTAGDVGSQFTPAAGWAQAIEYRARQLGEADYEGSISVALGGDAAVATNGFWSALNIATTLQLPLLFFIEDNGYGISVPSSLQTPGGNIAKNLRSYGGLRVLDGAGYDPVEASRLVRQAVLHVRSGEGPALLRLEVPRLSGHSVQDTQAYKSPQLIEEEQSQDPLDRLKDYLVPAAMGNEEWAELEAEAKKEVELALESALRRPKPDPAALLDFVFSDSANPARVGGLAADSKRPPSGSRDPQPEPTRINMLTAIRRTLEHELSVNPKVLVFGEDVGPKGGVHAATMGLQKKFGERRVFDTSLSEEGIVGRAVGMALAGLMPVPEIQFRKYADPATEQLNNCGTIRWRTVNRFAAPVVVRMPGGFAKCGDPWHSVTNEVFWAHAVGWRLAMPSNASDAVGLLRCALRGDDPTIFFEHRALLDSAWARRPYPGDDYVVPFGAADVIRAGERLTVVSWGAMVERCVLAAESSRASVEIIDLRTLSPWDKEAVLRSLNKTRRCLIVHEDSLTAGFGAEISATILEEAFFDLDAPVHRVAMPDTPVPYNVDLMNSILPSVERIREKMTELLEF